MLSNKDLTNLSSFNRRSRSYTLTTSFHGFAATKPSDTKSPLSVSAASASFLRKPTNKLTLKYTGANHRHTLLTLTAHLHQSNEACTVRDYCDSINLFLKPLFFLIRVPLYRCCTSPRSSCALEAERLSLKTPYVGCRQALRDTGCPLGTAHKRCPL